MIFWNFLHFVELLYSTFSIRRMPKWANCKLLDTVQYAIKQEELDQEAKKKKIKQDEANKKKKKKNQNTPVAKRFKQLKRNEATIDQLRSIIRQKEEEEERKNKEEIEIEEKEDEQGEEEENETEEEEEEEEEKDEEDEEEEEEEEEEEVEEKILKKRPTKQQKTKKGVRKATRIGQDLKIQKQNIARAKSILCKDIRQKKNDIALDIEKKKKPPANSKDARLKNYLTSVKLKKT